MIANRVTGVCRTRVLLPLDDGCDTTSKCCMDGLLGSIPLALAAAAIGLYHDGEHVASGTCGLTPPWKEEGAASMRDNLPWFSAVPAPSVRWVSIRACAYEIDI